MIYQIINFFSPVIHVLSVVIYLHLIQYLRIFLNISSLFSYLLFIVVILSEYLLTFYFERGDKSKKVLTFQFLIRISFWGFFYYMYVERPARIVPGEETIFVKYQTPFFFIKAKNVLVYARFKQTLIFFLALIVVYCFVVFHKKNIRTAFLVFIPSLMGLVIFAGYYFNILGGISDESIRKQKGVEIFIPINQIHQDGKQAINCANSTLNFPRSMYFDERRNKIYVNYGTGFSFHKRKTCFLQIDIKTKKFKALDIGLIRNFTAPDKSDKIYITGWKENKIYEISKDTFKIENTLNVNYGDQIPVFVPVDIYQDETDNFVFISNELYPSIIKYDLKNRVISKVAKFYEKNLAWEGSSCVVVKYAKKSNKLYAGLGFSKISLVELDADSLKVYRTMNLKGGVKDIAIDEANKTLFAVSILSPRLWEIDLNSWRVEKFYKIDPFCKNVRVSEDKIFALSELSGKLFVIDRKKGRITRKILVGDKPAGLHVSKSYIYVLSTTGIIRISLSD